MTAAGSWLVMAALLSLPQATPETHAADTEAADSSPARLQATVTTLGGTLAISPSPQAVRDGGTWYELLGEVYRGAIIAWTDSELVLQPQGSSEPVRIPLTDVVGVRFADAPPPVVGKDNIHVEVTDGSRLNGRALTLDGTAATLTSESLGTLTIPRAAVRNVRFAPLGELAEEWDELTQRVDRRDFLVIRKEKEVEDGDQKRIVSTLDHLQGTIAGMDGEFLQFLLDGNEIPVKREKVFGICLAQRDGRFGRDFVVQSVTGDRLACTALKIEDRLAAIRTGTGASLRVPLQQLQLIDYGDNRFVYLSALDPRTEEYTPYFDFTMPYRRDRYNYRLPLRVEGKRYARGLFLHSGTRLVYRLNGNYRRFQTVAGIDQEAGGGGNLDLTISGDGLVLFQSQITGRDPARILDLDVSDVRDLEILVEFGEDMGTLDHLDLADAKLLK